MPPHHRAPRARITFSDSAVKQLETITSEAQLHALDRALVVISVDPDLGEPISDEANMPSTAPIHRRHRATAHLVLRHRAAPVVVVAYTEV